MPAGRPTKYDPAMCDSLIESGKKGETVNGMACNLSISKDTLYRWAKDEDKPEFSDALKVAKTYSQQWWEKALRYQTMEGKGNATAAIFAMKNMFPDDYRDKREHKVDGEVGLFQIDYLGYQGEDAEDSPEED